MKETRKGLLRGVGILAALLLAAGAISPAFSAAPLTKAKVKKLAKKAVKQNIDDFGNPLFINESEFTDYGPITVAVGGSAPVATYGPFTFTASCLLDPAGGDTVMPHPVQGEVLIDTSEDNAGFESDDDSEDDFDAADPPEEWAQDTGNDPDILPFDSQDINGEDDEEAHALSQSGTALLGGTMIRTDYNAQSCTFFGYFFRYGAAVHA